MGNLLKFAFLIVIRIVLYFSVRLSLWTLILLVLIGRLLITLQGIFTVVILVAIFLSSVLLSVQVFKTIVGGFLLDRKALLNGGSLPRLVN